MIITFFTDVQKKSDDHHFYGFKKVMIITFFVTLAQKSDDHHFYGFSGF